MNIDPPRASTSSLAPPRPSPSTFAQPGPSTSSYQPHRASVSSFDLSSLQASINTLSSTMNARFDFQDERLRDIGLRQNYMYHAMVNQGHIPPYTNYPDAPIEEGPLPYHYPDPFLYDPSAAGSSSQPPRPSQPPNPTSSWYYRPFHHPPGGSGY